MSVRWLVFGVWGLAALSAVAWGLKLMARPEPVPGQATVAQVAPPAGGDWSRLLGASARPAAEAAAPPPPPDSARFQLVGLAAPRGPADGQGVALLVVDGKPARAYRQGASIDDRLVVRRIEPRRVTIGARTGEGEFDLELQPLPPPATGVPVAMAGAPGAAMPAGAAVPPSPAMPGIPGMPGAAPGIGPAVLPTVMPQAVQPLTPEQAAQMARRPQRAMPMTAPVQQLDTLPGEHTPLTGDGRDRR